MQHKGTVTIETPRLILRRFEMADLEPMFEHCWSHRKVWQWTNYRPMNTIEEVLRSANMFTPEWLGAYEHPNRYSWAIHHKQDNLPIGRLFGMHPDNSLEQLELAYELGPRWWNQGLMTEAVRAGIDFFFREVGMRRIYAYHADKNPASGHVMLNCGMRYIGTEPDGCTCNGGIFDRVNYEILAADFFGKRKRVL